MANHAVSKPPNIVRLQISYKLVIDGLDTTAENHCRLLGHRLGNYETTLGTSRA